MNQESLGFETKIYYTDARKRVVVTRHSALVEYLKEIRLISDETPVISHVGNPADIAGKIVIGVLPLNLAAKCAGVIEIPLALTAEDRGKELSVERVRELAGAPKFYQVREVVDFMV